MGIIEFIKYPRRCLGLLFLVLFSFYDAQLRGTPSFCRTLFIFSLFGLYNYIRYRKLVIGVQRYMKFGVGVLLCCLVTSILNYTFDIWVYQHYILTQILYLFAWFLIVKKAICKDMCLEEILHLLIYAVLVNNSIALLYFISPSLASFFLNIQEMDFSYANAEIVSRLYGIGMGGTNYGGGVASGFSLILIMYLLHKKYLRERTALLLFLFTTFSGMLIARTTMVGVCVALVGYAFLERSITRAFVFSLPIFFLFLCVVAFFMIYLRDILLFEHTFALFLNYLNGDGFTDGSMDTLRENHWKVVPTNIISWLFGEGHLTDRTGYYMHTDVGYLRAIFSFGLMGTLYFWGGLFRATLGAIHHYTRDRSLKKLLLVIFSFILIINLKGLSDDVSCLLWVPVFYVTMSSKQFIIPQK